MLAGEVARVLHAASTPLATDAALALLRRHRRRNTLKGRLLDFTAKVRSKL